MGLNVVEREEKIMDATMDIVAEVGLEGLSMRMLCDRVNLTAPLIYAIFDSKDELLYRSFLFVNRQIAGLFKGAALSEDATPEQVLEYIHAAWLRYFDFMVRNGNRTLYYYTYRDSTNLNRVLMRNNATTAEDMADFTSMFRVVAEKLDLFKDLSADFFFVFLLDGTGNFVRRVIREKRIVTPEEIESIWQLLTRGFLSFSGN